MESDRHPPEMKPECPASAIDNCVRSERVVKLLLEKVTVEDDFASVARAMLAIVGENVGADRCYIYRFPDGDDTRLEKLFEWIDPAAEGMAPAPAETLEAGFPGYNRSLADRQPIVVEDAECPPPSLSAEEIEDLHRRGIRSQLIHGIRIGHQLYGLIGLECLREKRRFPEAVIHTVDCFANLFRLTYERTRQKEELLESVSLQRQIMDNINIPILLVDLDYRVLAANPTKKVNVELPLDQLRGTRCYDTVCKFGAPPEFCSVQETLQTRKPSSKEFSFGPKRLISTAQPIFDRNGEMQYVLSADLDITEVTRQKEELKLAMEQARAANQAKSYFLATVSHELRTPLNAVIGFTELLQNGGIDEQTQQEYLRSISFAGNGLLNLINDVLDLSNLEANQAVITPTRNDVAELVRQVAAVFRHKTTEKKIELTTEIGELRYPLFVDNLRLRQILLNLIGNAIKFTGEGGVTVKASFQPEDRERGTLIVSVVDTGIGISPEHQERIFEPFVHDSVIRGKWMYEGSGLGLTITRRLLDNMGGSIRLESEPGRGSTFTVRLDQVRYDAAPELPPVEETAALSIIAERMTNRKIRVLLVDDIPLNLKVLAAMLKLLHAECTLAESAAAALALLREDRDYDLILTDMWMPDVSGIEFVARLREEGFGDIPTAVVTADTQISDRNQELFAYILYKPITVASLRQTLKAVLPAEYGRAPDAAAAARPAPQ